MDTNTITVYGRVGKTPESKQAGQSTKAEFRLGNNRGKDRDGNEMTNWYTVECWGTTANFVLDNIDKGDAVIVSGNHLLRSYENRDGQSVTVNLIQNATVQKLSVSQPSHDRERPQRGRPTEQPRRQREQSRPRDVEPEDEEYDF
jgi:single stranded DNA-binding protein